MLNLFLMIANAQPKGGKNVGTTTAKSTGKTTPIKKVKVTPRGGNTGTGGKTTRGGM